MRKHYTAAFSRIQKQKQLLMKVPLMMHLYQSIYCYNMHTKISRTRFRLDYQFSHKVLS